MWKQVFAKIAYVLAHIGVSAGDTDEVRLQKALLVFSALMMSTLAFAWGAMYFWLGYPIAGSIPSSYAVLSYATIALFAWTRRYQLFRASQLVLSLALPFLLMLSLGGFVNSSAVVLWSLTCPLGALVFAGRRQATLWFLAYLGLVFLSVFLDPWVAPHAPLPPWVVTIFFALNLTGVSVVAFVLLQYFVGQRDLSFGLLRLEQEKTENLLLNILPREIAAQLKNQPGTIANYYDEVTILFADLVGFTALSAALPPTEMVGWLNEIFTYFDELMDRYDVEKIETVGDEYMAACGVPRACPRHAAARTGRSGHVRLYGTVASAQWSTAASEDWPALGSDRGRSDRAQEIRIRVFRRYGEYGKPDAVTRCRGQDPDHAGNLRAYPERVCV